MVPKLPLSGCFVRKCGHFWSDFGIQVVKCIGLNIGRSYSKIYTKGGAVQQRLLKRETAF